MDFASEVGTRLSLALVFPGRIVQHASRRDQYLDGSAERSGITGVVGWFHGCMVRKSTNMYPNPGGSIRDETAEIEYIDGLFSYALMLTRNRSDAEDLVQEAYVRAIGAMARLRTGSNVKSWLFTILRNIWLNQLRRRRTTPRIVGMGADENVASGVVETSKNPHEAYVSTMERRQVREAIRQLPVDSREIILLREYEELSYQEIATILDCPAGTVMSRLGRARSKLRTLLAETTGSTSQEERRTPNE
jgi:RNA polymerase sigma-70 factor (ECF subfamily)